MYQSLVTSCIISIAIAFFVGAFRFNKFDKNIKWGVLLIAFALFTELSVMILSFIVVKGNNWIYYFTSPIEYVITSLYFYYLINSKIIKQLIIVFIPVTLVLAVLNAIYLQPPPSGCNNITILKGGLIAIWSLLYVKGLLKYSITPKKLNYSEFIIGMGLLFYYSFSVVYWTVYRYLLIKDPHHISVFLKIFPMMIIANIVMYMAFTVAFAVYKKPQPQIQYH